MTRLHIFFMPLANLRCFLMFVLDFGVWESCSGSCVVVYMISIDNSIRPRVSYAGFSNTRIVPVFRLVHLQWRQ